MGKAFAAWFLVVMTAANPSSSPRDVVQGAVTRVLAVVTEQGDTERATRSDDADQRRAELRRIAGEVFDFDEMARRSLSRHWATRSQAEQAEFTQHFTALLARTYLQRIESYAGERIRYPNEVIDGRYATVRSRILSQRTGRESTLDYRLRQADGRWKVFDIAVDGVSFVSTYRAAFDRVIQSSSYATLIDRMRKRGIEIDALGRSEQGSASPPTSGR